MIEICLTVLKLRANCTQPCFIYQSASLLLFHRCSTSLLFSRILLPRRSGETRKSVSAHVTPRAFRDLTTQALSSQTQHQFSCYRKASGFVFFLSFLFIQFQSTGFALRWESHCPCLKVNTPLVGASWAAPAIVTPPLSRSTHICCLTVWPVMGVHSTCTVCMLVCDDAVEAIGAVLTHAVSTVCLRCLTSVVEPCWWNTRERRLALALLFFFFLEASLWLGKTPAGWRGFAERAGTASATESQFCENWRFTWEQNLHYRLGIVWRGPHAVWCVRCDSISAWGDTEAVCFFCRFFSPTCLCHYCNPHAKRWAMCCIFARRYVVNVEAHTWTHHSVTISSWI